MDASSLEGLLTEDGRLAAALLVRLPAEVQRRVKALKRINAEHVAIEQKYLVEVEELEKKYLLRSSPLYQKRSEIISGSYEPTDEECLYDEDDDKDEDELPKIEEIEDGAEEDAPKPKKVKDSADAHEDGEGTQEKVAGIPGFWLTAMQNCDEIAEIITDEDTAILSSLADIRLSYLDGRMGFKLEFQFDENKYFENKTLTKVYELAPEKHTAYLTFEKSIGTPINWKPGKNVTVKAVTKKQKNKAGKVRQTTRQVKQKSFFNFFSPVQRPSDNEETDETDEALSKQEEEFDLDSEVGECFKSKLIPHAVLWFTGEAINDDDMMDFGSDMDDDGDDDGSDDDGNDPDFQPSAQNAEQCAQQ